MGLVHQPSPRKEVEELLPRAMSLEAVHASTSLQPPPTSLAVDPVAQRILVEDLSMVEERHAL